MALSRIKIKSILANVFVISGSGGVTSFNTRTGAVTLTSLDVTTALGFTPQQVLVSGTNIKTINGNSLLGSGNITISGGGGAFSIVGPFTSATNAAAGQLVLTDATSATVAVTLPTTPADGTQIAVKMIAQGSSAFVTTVAAGGSAHFNTSTGATSLTLTVLREAHVYQYQASTNLWFPIGDYVGIGQLDLRYVPRVLTTDVSILGAGSNSLGLGTSGSTLNNLTAYSNVTQFNNSYFGATSPAGIWNFFATNGTSAPQVYQQADFTSINIGYGGGGRGLTIYTGTSSLIESLFIDATTQDWRVNGSFGTNGQVLTRVSGKPQWATISGSGATWGSIPLSPALSTQTDLQNALYNKTYRNGLSLAGKNIYFYGDSYTVGVGATVTGQRFSSIVANYFGGIEQNFGISGSTMEFRTPTNWSVGATSMVEASRLATIPSNSDSVGLVIFAFGLNDMGYNGGQYTPANFITDFTTVLNNAITTKGIPASKIVIVAPFYLTAAGYTAYTGLNGTTPTAARNRLFAAAARTVAETFGIMFYDIYPEQAANDIAGANFNADNIHPNDNGHAFIGQALVQFLGNTSTNLYISRTVTGTSIPAGGFIQNYAASGFAQMGAKNNLGNGSYFQAIGSTVAIGGLYAANQGGIIHDAGLVSVFDRYDGTGDRITSIGGFATTNEVMRITSAGVVTFKKGYSVAGVLTTTSAGVVTNIATGGNGTFLGVSGGVLGFFTPAGSGTVTSVSVVSANGFAGSVATATSTPAITISTTITGILKGNGTAISAATAGTDYQAPLSLTTTGTSGAATLVGNTLNIPQYTGGGGSFIASNGTTALTADSGPTGAFKFILGNTGSGALSITGTWTATANNQAPFLMSGTITGDATTSDALLAQNNQGLTLKAGANTQVLAGVGQFMTFDANAKTGVSAYSFFANPVITGSLTAYSFASTVAAGFMGVGTITPTTQIQASNTAAGGFVDIQAVNASITGFTRVSVLNGPTADIFGIVIAGGSVSTSGLTLARQASIYAPSGIPSILYRADDTAANHIFVTGGFATTNERFRVTTTGTTITGNEVVTQRALSSAWAPVTTISPGAHTSMTASTEFPNTVINTVTQTWATGALTIQRSNWIKSPTLAFAGASTVTDAFNLYVDANIAGSGPATITNNWALGVNGNAKVFGNLVVGTNAITAGSVLADFQSTTLGIVVPRVTAIASITTPVNGMIAYDATLNQFNFRENGAWTTSLGAMSVTTNGYMNLSGSALAVPIGNNTWLTPTVAGQTLRYNGTNTLWSVYEQVGTYSASATLPLTQKYISFTGTTAAQTLTLPAIAGNTGKDYIIKNRSTQTLVVSGPTASTVYDTAVVTTTNILAGQSLTFCNDGTYWTTN